MRGPWRRLLLTMLAGEIVGAAAFAQTALSWEQVRERFEAVNPTLKSAQLSIDESRAAEITAYLRPNPDLTFTMDGFQPGPTGNVWRP
ncbi:MAG: TolC family protein, partial [Acidobacteriia bacterium]|nr:TolC family protein [Terriglobia bacterium]